MFSAAARAYSFRWSFLLPSPGIRNKIKMDSRPGIVHGLCSRSSSSSPPKESCRLVNGGESISLQEWQGWGTSSQIPAQVMEIVEDMRALEKDMDAQMSFGGLGGKLQGNFKVQEDKKHRAKYKALVDSEKKIQFFSARQIACRLLGSRGYLCQKCWLAADDCMCSKIIPSSLLQGIRFWLYMHPKDFLRQNNTGKLLLQIFGAQAATLCLFGIPEHEDIMWDAFKIAGKNRVWCLYPDKSTSQSVPDILLHGSSTSLNAQQVLLHIAHATNFNGDLVNDIQRGGNFHIDSTTQTNGDGPLNFILIDGTWNNSAAMFRRLKDCAKLAWGEEDLPCISLSTLGVSAMHKLRPQPSWDRTCTAAAAISLLSELHSLPEFSLHGLDKHAEAVEDGLEALSDALTTRRLRMGRSITRSGRHNDIF